MQWFYDLISNPFLITGVSSWAIAQVLKVILYWIIYKKLVWERFIGDGGMPSCHSATVASLAVICGLICGLNSAEFAISMILAIVVCHDAMGVRRETGKQAVVINDLIEAFNELSKDALPEVKLKEFVGHSPVQVLAGILIGVANAFLMYAVLI